MQTLKRKRKETENSPDRFRGNFFAIWLFAFLIARTKYNTDTFAWLPVVHVHINRVSLYQISCTITYDNKWNINVPDSS